MNARPITPPRGGTVRLLLTILAVCCALVAFANFGAFFIDSMQLGGDAGNGYVRDGHYFVGDHGTYTEVPEARWRRNSLQGKTILITHLLGMAGMAYLLFTRIFPARMRRGSAQAVAAQVRLLEAGAAPLVSGRCAGRIGGVNFSGPLLNVSVFPTGVVIKPIFMSPLALSLEEIEAVGFERVLFTQALAIAHRSPNVPSSILLYCRPNDPVATTLRSLVDSQ